MKILFFVVLLGIILYSWGIPIEEEDVEKMKEEKEDMPIDDDVFKVKGKDISVSVLGAVADDHDIDDGDDEHDIHKGVFVHRKPFNLHIDIPHIFNLKLFRGPEGHTLGIGVFPGIQVSSDTITKRKF